ncbi:hypothetical protein BS47DRAFT_1351605 [Hydnum rufescens UP504]|uniref:DRBM domain-containing protein n=1 Tax=Hydnum rufescens UP504 TaxID=1448309 RepID=A0A9P6ALD9_9AGAM|nr:hypothetical protein BS47DRAFT_1351605 [Hydnum rufescens UP504]
MPPPADKRNIFKLNEWAQRNQSTVVYTPSSFVNDQNVTTWIVTVTINGVTYATTTSDRKGDAADKAAWLTLQILNNSA